MNLSRHLRAFLLVLAVSVSAHLSPVPAFGHELPRADAVVRDNSLVVSTTLRLDDREVEEIKSGVSREITFYIDLFRVWRNWPDEFVLGKSFVRKLKCDQIKKEYIATSFDGFTLTEKRFQNCESLLSWAMSIESLKLTNTAELPTDNYFVRYTAESRLRRLPPIISQLLFFVPEKEFSVSRDSQPFRIIGK